MAAAPRSSGIRVVFNNLDSIARAIPGGAERIVSQTAQAIAGAAQSQAPVDTGELRGSINAHSAGPLHWQVEAGTDHAAYVEYGTARHGAAQPYMTPAAHQQEPKFAADMQNLIPGA